MSKIIKITKYQNLRKKGKVGTDRVEASASTVSDDLLYEITLRDQKLLATIDELNYQIEQLTRRQNATLKILKELITQEED